MELVTRCVAAAQLEPELAELTATLLSKSYSSRRAIKYLVNQGLKGSLAEGLHLEAAYLLHYETTHPDAHEGLVAFAEKRKPRFRPRSQGINRIGNLPYTRARAPGRHDS